MSDPTMTNIALFFEDHETYPPPPREYSVLYFLRRDIRTCMRTNPDTYPALFVAAMVIFAGIDLLGKFLAGDDSFERGKSRERFENFFKEYFQTVSQDDAEIIYQLRNALMHSFGLYSRADKATNTGSVSSTIKQEDRSLAVKVATFTL
jgi:hypothetical protein